MKPMNTILLSPNYVKQCLVKVIVAMICLFIFSSCTSDTSADAVVETAAKEGVEIGTAAAMYVTPATEDIVMYEINIGAFSSTRNLRDIINRLDAIKALGVNTIWLMPIYPVGTVNSFGSPYCVKNFINHKAKGSPMSSPHQ